MQAVARSLVPAAAHAERPRLAAGRQDPRAAADDGRLYERNVRSRTLWAVDASTGTQASVGTVTNKLAIRGSAATTDGLVLLLGSSGLEGPTSAALRALERQSGVSRCGVGAMKTSRT